MSVPELRLVPVSYAWLSDLYEHVNQEFCLNQIPVPPDEENSRAYFNAVRSGLNHGAPFIARAVYVDNKPVGKAELTLQEDGSAELDLIIVRKWCGKGIGTAVLNQLKEYCVQEQFCTGIAAYVQEDNRIMRHVLEKCGFEEGRTFHADVVTPQGGSYRLTAITGKEYLLAFR